MNRYTLIDQETITRTVTILAESEDEALGIYFDQGNYETIDEDSERQNWFEGVDEDIEDYDENEEGEE